MDSTVSIVTSNIIKCDVSIAGYDAIFVKSEEINKEQE
jgi:hypothetical protein